MAVKVSGDVERGSELAGEGSKGKRVCACGVCVCVLRGE